MQCCYLLLAFTASRTTIFVSALPTGGTKSRRTLRMRAVQAQRVQVPIVPIMPHGLRELELRLRNAAQVADVSKSSGAAGATVEVVDLFPTPWQ